MKLIKIYIHLCIFNTLYLQYSNTNSPYIIYQRESFVKSCSISWFLIRFLWVQGAPVYFNGHICGRATSETGTRNLKLTFQLAETEREGYREQLFLPKHTHTHCPRQPHYHYSTQQLCVRGFKDQCACSSWLLVHRGCSRIRTEDSSVLQLSVWTGKAHVKTHVPITSTGRCLIKLPLNSKKPCQPQHHDVLRSYNEVLPTDHVSTQP